MKLHDHHSTAKALIAFLIVFIAFGILVVFKMNADSVFMSGNFTFFMLATTIGLGLLVGLFYLVNQPHHTNTKKSSSKKKK